MTTATGLDAQFGITTENTYGTYVAPTRFYEFTNEKIAADIQKINSKAIRSSRYQRADRVTTYVAAAGGDVSFEVLTKGFGLLLKHMLGHVSVIQPDPDTKPNEYVMTFTPDAAGKAGLSLTAQVGRPDVTTNIASFSYVGGKITQWELSAAVDEALMLSTSFDFKTEETSHTLAAASYPSDSDMLTFIGGSVKINGSDFFVSKASVACADSLKTDRRGMGNEKREPLANGPFDVTGSLDAEFEGIYNHIKVTAGTQGSLELAFTYGEIDEGQSNPFMLKVILPVIEFTGDTPTVSGPDVVAHPLKFRALKNDADPLITVEYHTTDNTL